MIFRYDSIALSSSPDWIFDHFFHSASDTANFGHIAPYSTTLCQGKSFDAMLRLHRTAWNLAVMGDISQIFDVSPGYHPFHRFTWIKQILGQEMSGVILWKANFSFQDFIVLKLWGDEALDLRARPETAWSKDIAWQLCCHGLVIEVFSLERRGSRGLGWTLPCLASCFCSKHLKRKKRVYRWFLNRNFAIRIYMNISDQKIRNSFLYVSVTFWLWQCENMWKPHLHTEAGKPTSAPDEDIPELPLEAVGQNFDATKMQQQNKDIEKNTIYIYISRKVAYYMTWFF